MEISNSYSGTEGVLLKKRSHGKDDVGELGISDCGKCFPPVAG